MPNVNRDQTMYVQTANPDTWYAETLQRPGELGKAYDYNDRTYQRVKLDSGATSANTVGVVAANQLAFWKDKSKYIVTNDARQALLGGIGVLGIADSYTNNVAGIFRAAITAGYYCDVLVRGYNIAVKEAGSATGGMSLEATGSSATTAGATGIAIGTQNTHQKIGVVRTATSANVCYADVDIANIP
jgi:hypothetical protein